MTASRAASTPSAAAWVAAAEAKAGEGPDLADAPETPPARRGIPTGRRRLRNADIEAHLLTVIARERGEWTVGRAKPVYRRLLRKHVYRATIRRHLARLEAAGHLVRHGDGTVRRYYTYRDTASDFFQAGHSYRAQVHGDFRFRCLAVGIHPATGERHAFGWRYVARIDRWRFAALRAADWECCHWTADTDTPATGKDGAP